LTLCPSTTFSSITFMHIEPKTGFSLAWTVKRDPGDRHRLMSLEEIAHLVCSWRVRPLGASDSEISRLLCRFHADFHQLSDLLGDIL
jgi:hypothetical protein